MNNDESTLEKDELLRMTISRQSEKALIEIIERVNEGFIGGKVNKTQMANWILRHFKNQLDESLIRDIRADHYDEVAVLESILKKAKETGKVPTEFKHLLQKQIGLDVSAKKKSKTSLTGEGINDAIM